MVLRDTDFNKIFLLYTQNPLKKEPVTSSGKISRFTILGTTSKFQLHVICQLVRKAI